MIKRLLGVMGAVTALMFAVMVPANPAAALGGDHDGDADRSSATHFTEDNDSDGTANNVADPGDNAHPSGKDRSVEQGRSGIQGHSESDPDDNGRGPERTNRGSDRPNGSGGIDRFDQDGNNGCGNDDDFEDDNEGRCLGRRHQHPSKPPAPQLPSTMPSSLPGSQALPVVPFMAPGTVSGSVVGNHPLLSRPPPDLLRTADLIHSGLPVTPGLTVVEHTRFIRSPLAATGSPAAELTTAGLGLMMLGALALITSVIKRPQQA